MKTIYLFIICSICVASFLVSCEKELDLVPQNNASLDNFFQSPEDLEQGLVGTYDALQESGQYGFNFIYFMEIRSDNSFSRSITNSGGEFGDIELFREQPTNSRLNATWSSCYRAIQRANVIVNRAFTIDMDDAQRNIIVSEAKVIRALSYFNLVRIWGGVPIILEETQDPFDFIELPRATLDETYFVIEQDLLEAIESLPMSAADGRITQGTAKTILGKVYLTLQRFADAVTQLGDVIVSGQYELQPNYNDVFLISKENNSESIFEIQYTSGFNNEGSAFANSMAIDQSQVGGIGAVSGDNLPTPDIINAYDDNDTRKDVNIGSINGGFFCAKYIQVPNQPNDGDKNFIVLRYADVLLMYAEALNELGYQSNGEAFNALNEVRTRAINDGAYIATDLPDQQSFREAIALERRLELAFENHRWFDLLRTGKAIEVMGTHTLKDGSTATISTNQLLFPVPQAQIDASGGVITQNPGY